MTFCLFSVNTDFLEALDGSVIISAQSSNASYNVLIVENTISEIAETFTCSLSISDAVGNGNVSICETPSITIEIVDNDRE